MEHTDCKATNQEGNHFCGQCGARLGQPSEETVREKGVRERQVIEMELTEAVAGRLLKWAGWLGKIATVIVVLFGVLLGKSYFDIREAVNKGEAEISSAMHETIKEVEAVRIRVKEVGIKVTELHSDIAQYRQVNNTIKNLEKDVKDVRGQMIDLGRRGLRAAFFESTASGPSFIGLKRLECPATAEGNAILYCAGGSPPSLLQRTSTGELKPVSSFSPKGFQDVSTEPKPACTLSSRGTIYVEKGRGEETDKPFLCARLSNGRYDWIQLAIRGG